MRNKTILVVHTPVIFGGAERLLLQIISEFKKKFQIVLLARSPSFFNVAKNFGINAFLLNAKEIKQTTNPIYIFIFLFRIVAVIPILLSLLKNFKPNLIYISSWDAFLFTVIPAKLLNIPILYHCHGLLKPRPITKIVYKNFIAPYATFFIAVSEAVKYHYIKLLGVPQEKIRIIYNGVPLPLLKRRAPKQRIIVATLSRIEPSKGIHIFVMAAEEILKNRQDLEFWIVGRVSSPHYRVWEKKLIHRVCYKGMEEHIKFIDWQDRINEIFHKIDIFVCCSIEPEGLPLSILEAMSFAKPVIASQVGGIPEVVIDNKTGLLVPPGDVRALSDAILCLALDKSLQRKFGGAGRELIRNRFSYNQFLDSFESIFHRFLNT